MTNKPPKTVFISGISSGIGRAAAIKFLESGYRIKGCGRSAKEKIQPALPDQIEYIECDISNPSQISKIAPAFENVDILINNAGLGLGLGHFDTHLPSDLPTLINTNVFGLMEMTRLTIPPMRKRGTGHIINIGSIAGYETYENGALYCATKAAVHAFTRGLKKDLTGSGIRVSLIAPGKVETNFSTVRFRGDKEKAKKAYEGYRPLKPENIAETIFWIATQPPHVEITEITILATDQQDAAKIRPV